MSIFFSFINNIVQCEPAVAPHAKCISNKGKPDTGNTSLWLSGHFQYFSSNKKRHWRAGLNLLILARLRDVCFIEQREIKASWTAKKKKKKHRLGSAALTRNEAKSMSTRLLAGESFAIFQIKAELSFAWTKKNCRCIIGGDFSG